MIITSNIEQALKILELPEILIFDDVQVKRISSFSESPSNLQIKLTYKGESYIYEIICPENESVII
jgi:hypothetical protein